MQRRSSSKRADKSALTGLDHERVGALSANLPATDRDLVRSPVAIDITDQGPPASRARPRMGKRTLLGYLRWGTVPSSVRSLSWVRRAPATSETEIDPDAGG